MSPILFSLESKLAKRRGIIVVTLAALIVRLVWNLFIHRPLDAVYSDMAGYLDRANLMIDKPTLKGPWLVLFPYGTHFFIFAVKRLFGRDNATAIGVAYAVLGALAVGYTYATAERFVERRLARRIVAVILVFYYPWISLGGYTLSEIPFTFCLAGLAYHGLLLADHGRKRDAWMVGLFTALGVTVRPQILLGLVLLGVHFVLRRRLWKHFRYTHVLRVAVPVVLILGASSWRLHNHIGRWGLVSTNGPLNWVFGRCHNTGLTAQARDGVGFFGPPPLGALRQYQKEHKHPLFTLDPAFTENLTIQGHMWDDEPNYKLASSCVQKTGYFRQAKYAITHVVLLWGYNIIWPDQGGKLEWRLRMAVACVAHAVLILPPAAIALLLAFRRRRARSMLIALHVWGVIIMAMLYFGDTRYRAPYDGLLVILAIQTYAEIIPLVRRGFEHLRSRRLGAQTTRPALGAEGPRELPT